MNVRKSLPDFTTELLRGIEEFNAGYFFEAHDTLEDIWIGEQGRDRLFYQGLIHLAVGFYHLSMENTRGAKSQLNKGLTKLEEFKPDHNGIELTNSLEQVKSCIEELKRIETRAQIEKFDVSLIPKLGVLSS